MIKKPVIKCPHCGREYLASEIFYPNDFLGHATNVVRNSEGEILVFDGPDMDLSETYTCDECGTKFKTEASVNFKTEEVKDLFSEEDEF